MVRRCLRPRGLSLGMSLSFPNEVTEPPNRYVTANVMMYRGHGRSNIAFHYNKTNIWGLRYTKWQTGIRKCIYLHNEMTWFFSDPLIFQLKCLFFDCGVAAGIQLLNEIDAHSKGQLEAIWNTDRGGAGRRCSSAGMDRHLPARPSCWFYHNKTLLLTLVDNHMKHMTSNVHIYITKSTIMSEFPTSQQQTHMFCNAL